MGSSHQSRLLRSSCETPPFVFAQGRIETEDPGLSVVGSRKASPRGLEMATDIATYLVDAGLAVISGLAAGIDAAAHTAALKLRGVGAPSRSSRQARCAVTRRRAPALMNLGPVPCKWCL